MFNPVPGKGRLCPTHGAPVGIGRGKCPDCARIAHEEHVKTEHLHAFKTFKQATGDEDDDEERPSLKRRCIELEETLEEVRTERDETEKARSKLSVENMKLRLMAEKAAEEAKQLRGLLEIARERALVEKIPLPPPPAASAGAGVRAAGDRNVQSCSECQTAKIRCDGIAPEACGQCIRRGRTCEYRDPMKRGPKRKREEAFKLSSSWVSE